MSGKGGSYSGWVTGVLIVSFLVGGCHRQATPEAKQARLIAAESMQLKKQLAERDAEIDELKRQHAKAIEQHEEELNACRQRIEALEADLRGEIVERVNSVLKRVMDQNSLLREEIRQLRETIEESQSSPSQTP